MGYGDKTLREISAQPDAWRHSLETLDRSDLDSLIGDKDPRTHQWLFIGCGTSFHLAEAAADTFRVVLGVSARGVPASEVLFYPEITLQPQSNLFPILISRSGHTSEVVQVAELLKRRGIDFLALTCDGNELGELSSRILKLPVLEESIVMTSSFTSMLLALQYLAARFAQATEFLDGLRALPAALEPLLPKYAGRIEKFAEVPFQDIAFLAQGPLYPIAREASLKVMESSSSYAQFFHTLEFRHGPKSIVSDGVIVGGLLSERGYAEESVVLQEMKELGGRIIAIANELTPNLRNSADLAIELSLRVPETARLVVYLVWGQLLGLHFGLSKGLDPDSPRHLSRVVTFDPVS